MKPEALTAPHADHDLIDFPELARTIGRYKWGILAIAVLFASTAAMVALSMEKIFRGSVTVLIEPRNQRVVQVQDVYDPGYGTDEYYATQTEVMRSRNLAAAVVDRLNLVERRDEMVGGGAPRGGIVDTLDLRAWLPFLPEEAAPLSGPAEKERLRDIVIDQFRGAVTIEAVPRTQLVRAHFESLSPELSAEAANAIADLFIEAALQSKLDATRKATEWLTARLADIKTQLEKSEMALQAFLETEQLVNVGGARNLTEEELVDYSRRLREAQKRRSELASAYEKVRQAGNDPRRLRDISVLLIDPLVQKANESVLVASEMVKGLEERYGAKHPQMAAARARLETAQAALSEQLRVATAGVKNEYEIAQQNERELQRQVTQSKGQIQHLDRKDYQMSVLQREVATNRELYNTFLTRFKETDTAGNFEALNARIVDPAVVPRLPYKPEKKKIVLIAAAAGLLAGMLLALLRHLLSEEIRSAEDLEALTRLPVFGVLPLVGKSFMFGEKNLAHTYLDKPKTPFAEGVRSIRAALQLSDVDKRFKRILITSSVPKEGKSSVASTLALACGAVERVLLIDADLRIPTLHKVLDLPARHKGLTDVLTGRATLEECMYKHEKGGIWILPTGEPPTNPAELLASGAMRSLLEEVAKSFDRIILDTPPAQAASDALLLSQYVNAVLFVVKSDSTSRRAVKNSIKQLQYSRAPLLGNIVNQVDVRRNPYYMEGYYYAYGYYG